jgi:glycogen operon protein
VDWEAASTLPYVPGGEDADLDQDGEDDGAAIPKCVVIDPTFNWEGDTHLNTPWHETVIYEVHVKGFTALHPGVREDLRGTYAGLASEEAIAHLRSLGVTAVELLPIHHIIDEHSLVERGLRNYWGYSSIGYLAPHALYSATGRYGEQLREFKGMVKALHRAGIEVILDVVYNHTAEGNHLGPMLGFKGVDNASYYRLVPDDPRYYMDFTGTGNSLNPVHPSVLRLIMDSLRYFVIDCHVDGFRFDLAAALAREFYDVDRLSAFFDTIHQDPVLSQVKLIAEPWDVGPGGYQVGNFPILWTEWNGLYRDCIRDFWRGQCGLAEFAQRFTGSSDLYQSDGRRPAASINFVTAHDGFTLNDLVSYNEKHNEANLEDNRDGTDDNRSWNSGIEGPTDDPEVCALREKQMRNFLTTLLLSQGVPMLLGGDELARTQDGNNNAYCQDNEISWFAWELDERKQGLLEFARRMIHFRAAHPVFRRTQFLTGDSPLGSGLPDSWWFRPDGRKMTRRDWADGELRSIGLFLNGEEIPARTRQGDHVTDESFLLLFNSHYEPVTFLLPPRRFGTRWKLELSTSEPHAEEGERSWPARGEVEVDDRSIVLLRRGW